MESIWRQNTELPKRESLKHDITVDTAVIGGGMAGILTALLLQEKGVQTAVLEAETAGHGQTGNTTAKITSQHSLIYHSLIQLTGRENARLYANINRQAIKEYERIIAANEIECSFVKCPSYLYSTGENTLFLMAEANDAASLGIDASYTDVTTLPFPVSGAVKFENQAQFHPLLFLKAAADKVTVYEHTPVVSVEEGMIKTPEAMVKADHVVFATHYPFLKSPGYYFLRMYQERSYCLALENAASLDGMYLSADPDGLSFRSCGSLMLLGGGSHRTGENKQGGRYDFLRERANNFYPECIERAHWSAQDCMTPDGIPYIGRFSKSTPDWYVATGFNKWGMTSSMVSAMLISDLITGRENPCTALFSPLRPFLSGPKSFYLEHGLKSAKGLSKEHFHKPELTAEDLPAGHGGIVSYNGGKAAVYRDENDKLYAIPSKCPHMGCQLEWNPDDKTWDCPCHGSRFDYHGRLLNGPAQEDNTL